MSVPPCLSWFRVYIYQTNLFTWSVSWLCNGWSWCSQSKLLQHSVQSANYWGARSERPKSLTFSGSLCTLAVVFAAAESAEGTRMPCSPQESLLWQQSKAKQSPMPPNHRNLAVICSVVYRTEGIELNGTPSQDFCHGRHSSMPTRVWWVGLG